MRIRSLYLCALLFITSVIAMAQSPVRVSGYVKDAANGEALVGATVYCRATQQGAVADPYGYFSLQLGTGADSLRVSFIGYADTVLTVASISGILTVQLPAGKEIQEVSVTSTHSAVTAERITAKTVSRLPVVMGESDITRTVQMMPGVVAGNESTAGYFIRGGNADQNLLLIDGAPVYNAYHMMGLFSVFNSDAINSAKFYSGSMPATYGGRLSSVMDLSLREGNAHKLSGELMLGTFTSKFLLEGPIVKDRTSFLITGRRSTLDKMPLLLVEGITMLSGIDKSMSSVNSLDQYRFWDINAKVNHQFSAKSKLFASWYKGSDTYNPKIFGQNSNRFNFGNQSMSLRYNQILSPSLSANITLYHTRYGYESTRGQIITDKENKVVSENNLTTSTGISDYSAQATLHQDAGRHRIAYGLQYLRQTLTPGAEALHFVGADSNENVDTSYSSQTTNHSTNLFVSDDFAVTPRLLLTLGMRLDATFAGSAQYLMPQPRIIGKYSFTERLFARASYTRTAQNIQVLSFSSGGAPTDMWVPATSRVRPATADEFVVGGGYDLGKGISFSLDLFERRLRHLIMYREGASYISGSGDWQDMVATGHGAARGAELQLKKEAGSTSGWVSYTLSKSERQFDDLNLGRSFPFTYDRRHSFSLALMQKLGKRWDLGASWVYATGYAVTLREAKYTIFDHSEGSVLGVMSSSSLNNARMPAMHRLDLCVNYARKAKYIGYKWSLGAYNIYGRENPYYVEEGWGTPTAVGMFKVLPYCSLSLTF